MRTYLGYPLKGKYKSKYLTFRDKLSKKDWVEHFLKITHVENMDFAEVIKKYDSPNTYFYVDPPYWKTENYYSNHDFDRQDHERLANVLHGVKGKFSLSYYDFELLNEWFPKDQYTWVKKEFAKANIWIYNTNIYTNICYGNTSINEIKTLDISLPHGIDNGQFLRLSGMGDYKNNTYGDLIVRIELKSENGFDKIENNLIYNSFINLKDLKLGKITVPHPDGILTLKLPKDFDSSVPLRVKLKGFKLGTVGDLIVNQYIKYSRD